MGFVYEEITLKNAIDVGNCGRGFIKEQEVRQITVQALVDTGAATLVINEDIRQKLGLEILGQRSARLANNTREICKITEPIEIHWKNRSCSLRAFVLPESSNVLLGAIPLEDMDLIVDPTKQILTGAHGDEAVSLIM